MTTGAAKLGVTVFRVTSKGGHGLYDGPRDARGWFVSVERVAQYCGYVPNVLKGMSMMAHESCHLEVHSTKRCAIG